MSATMTMPSDKEKTEADLHRFRRDFPGSAIETCAEELQAIAKMGRVGIGDEQFTASLLLCAIRSAGRLYGDLVRKGERWGVLDLEDPEAP